MTTLSLLLQPLLAFVPRGLPRLDMRHLPRLNFGLDRRLPARKIPRTIPCLALALGLALATPAALAIDASECAQNGGTTYCEPKVLLWGSFGYRVPDTQPSFGEIFAARIGAVMETTGPGAYPVFSPGAERCGPANCATEYTQQYSTDFGRISAERITAPGSYYSAVRYGQFVTATRTCRPGLSPIVGSDYCYRTGPEPDKNTGPAPECRGEGNPIDPANGNKYQVEVDYAGTAHGDLRFVRYYNSNASAYGSLGNGWRMSYDRRVIAMDAGSAHPSVMVRRESGQSLVFSRWGGAWRASGDISDRLEQGDESSGAVAWRFYDSATDAVERYDTSGRLLSIQSRSGLVSTLVYSDTATAPEVAPRAGLLIEVRDSFGSTLRLTWTAQGRIATVTDPSGGVYRYRYSAKGNLTGVSFPGESGGEVSSSPTRTYTYEHATCTQALTGVIDERGERFATYTYDAACRATSTQHAGGAGLVTLSYDGNQTSITDAGGNTRKMRFELLNGVWRTSGVTQPCAACGAGAAASTTFDTNGNPAVRTDFNGHRTEYRFDPLRNLETRRVEGLSVGEDASGSPSPASVARTRSTEWHARWRLPVRIAEPRRITTLTYDEQGQLIRRDIQPTADLNGAQGFDAPPAGSLRTWTYNHTYSGTLPGLVLRSVVDGPRGGIADTTTYDWNEAGQLLRITNALGHVTRFEDYDAHGRARRITDPNGAVTTLAYDPRGRLTAHTVAGDRTDYFYDGAGLLTQVRLPDGATLRYGYDAAQRLTSITDALGNSVAYTLDARGNRIRDAVRDPQGNLARSQAREFDRLNRLVTLTGGAGSEITGYGYDAQGNLTGITNGLGVQFTRQYDALDRLIRQVDPAALDGHSATSTRLAYDARDNLVQVTDPRGLQTTYRVDALDQRTRTQSPDTGTSTFTYDLGGNLTGHTDARGVMLTYSYDALNRPLTLSKGTSVLAQYVYDEGEYGKGRLSRVVNRLPGAQITSSYAYDAKGRWVSKTQTNGSLSHTVAYGYNGADRLASLTYPSGRVVRYAYDAAGQVESISVDGSVILRAVRYHPFGPASGWTWGNGQTYSREIDASGRVAAYPVAPGVTWALSFDAAGQISAIKKGTLTQSLRYDRMGRLIGSTQGTRSYGYQYDATGNRTALRVGDSTYTYTTAAASNRLLKTSGPGGVSTFSYSAAGNATRAGNRALTYGNLNRMESSTVEGVRTSYANTLIERIGKTPGAATPLHYVYDEDAKLLGEYDASGAIQETVYLGSQPVAVLKGASVFYVYADHLGTPRGITDTSNRLRWQWDSAEPFGTTPVDQDPSALGTFQYNLRFPGQYLDPESNLFYNYSRYYDPQIGRYLQSDPIGLEGGINTYSYANTNPLSYTDLLGLNPGAGCLAGAWAGPFGCGVGAGIGTAIMGGMALAAILSTPADSTKPEQCTDKQCPPCKTLSGRIVPVGTIGYRPLDTPSKPQHGIVGPHHNIYKANQIPAPKCDCFWQSVGAVPPSGLPAGAIPIEPFAN